LGLLGWGRDGGWSRMEADRSVWLGEMGFSGRVIRGEPVIFVKVGK
jgi:hypothetical protein